MEITLTHIYPDLLNQYGDFGNILTFKKRLEKRDIKVTVKEIAPGEVPDFDNTDILYIGGGSEKANLAAYEELFKIKDSLKDYIEKGKVALSVCGGYEMLGKSFSIAGKEYEGLGITDTVSVWNKKRIIGNIVIHSELLGFDIVGFENHTGRCNIATHTPLGNVTYGYGNSDKKDFEGIIYKNLIGTYIHGPLLPKNPLLADHIISCALQNKYGKAELAKLDDTIENNAHNYIKVKYVK